MELQQQILTLQGQLVQYAELLQKAAGEIKSHRDDIADLRLVITQFIMPVAAEISKHLEEVQERVKELEDAYVFSDAPPRKKRAVKRKVPEAPPKPVERPKFRDSDSDSDYTPEKKVVSAPAVEAKFK